MNGSKSRADKAELQRYAVSVGGNNMKVLKVEGE
ncbi:hypothetical protein FHS14_004360 [Paenibacillus baekrokdamisoli]|nr:hypothetical protein [Paenibacillus baekrokdamisoli]